MVLSIDDSSLVVDMRVYISLKLRLGFICSSAAFCVTSCSTVYFVNNAIKNLRHCQTNFTHYTLLKQ